jgi:hypothetical protein
MKLSPPHREQAFNLHLGINHTSFTFTRARLSLLRFYFILSGQGWTLYVTFVSLAIVAVGGSKRVLRVISEIYRPCRSKLPVGRPRYFVERYLKGAGNGSEGAYCLAHRAPVAVLGLDDSDSLFDKY